MSKYVQMDVLQIHFPFCFVCGALNQFFRVRSFFSREEHFVMKLLFAYFFESEDVKK